MGWISMAAGGVIGGIFGHNKQDEDQAAADEAADLQRREAELAWQATQEAVRRMEVSQNEILSQAHVDVGASGFSSTSKSQTKLITETSDEFEDEREFALTTGMNARDIAMLEADYTQKYGASGGGGTTSGVLSGINLGMNASNWWSS